MFFKVALLACTLAVCQAGFLGAQYALPAQYAVESPALASTYDNILRSPGNLAQISSHQKTISTPFSSSSKSDVRVTNPSILSSYHQAAPLAPVPIAYAGHAAATPLAYSAYSAPAPAATFLAHPVGPAASRLGVAYSPAVAVSHMAYTSPIGISYSY